MEDGNISKTAHIKVMMRNRRLAVLAGCNYPNTPYRLHGCINDVIAMRDTLVTHFGFDKSSVQLLVDDEPDNPGRVTVAAGSILMPTGANIKKALDCIVDQAMPGDVLFFHYSGHGTRISSGNHSFSSRQDEAIVPCDFNLITDVDLRQLVDRVPKGASFTIISDSCHSGGLIDREKEQIGPSSISMRNFTLPKNIPLKVILEHLGGSLMTNTSNVGTYLLVEVFGADSSLSFRLPASNHHHSQYLLDDEGILLSGCQANETSADVNQNGKAYGAFSNAIQTVLKNEQFAKISNKQLVLLTRKLLRVQQGDGGIEQHPCLYCSDQNTDATFLCQP